MRAAPEGNPAFYRARSSPNSPSESEGQGQLDFANHKHGSNPYRMRHPSWPGGVARSAGVVVQVRILDRDRRGAVFAMILATEIAGIGVEY